MGDREVSGAEAFGRGIGIVVLTCIGIIAVSLCAWGVVAIWSRIL
jgi:hypothetical protein